jgi:1-aminocyclopropane-1-carboxylate deaminase/D-cysteine desulfhydrase-like pyridoxal-dependent ACC family enzyme
MLLDVDLERVPLGEGPTPVRELVHLGEERGQAPIWIKDDGAYSAFGGNKARKLAWLLADARRRRKRTILTGGALGTNHGLATALFARRLGMRTVLVLVPQPDSEHVRRQLERIRAAADVEIERGWLGPGYGHSTPAADRATELFGEREDIVLEPVYTSKAVAAMLELNRRGAFGPGPLLYWHTYSRPED